MPRPHRGIGRAAVPLTVRGRGCCRLVFEAEDVETTPGAIVGDDLDELIKGLDLCFEVWGAPCRSVSPYREAHANGSLYAAL